jgi:FAD/FMN-containing dehydrogenase/Fe-S oxidoreductase
MTDSDELFSLKNSLEGDLFYDTVNLLIHATDASAYREMPAAVARPKNKDDIRKLILFASEHNTSLIPRTAGTSLAGQVVGGGIVADVSKYMTRILEFNAKEHWVRVQPGVVLDELNKEAEKLGLFFGPETSTSNRCMMGGMVGNNSCGAHSLIYGSTRTHTVSVKTLLSDGSEAEFGPLTKDEFKEKLKLQNLEGDIYRNINSILSDSENQKEIVAQYPAKTLERRNTGYAIDLLLDCEPFQQNGEEFNFCKLIAGSEGTLAFITEIKLNLVPLPPKEKVLVCVHLNSVKEALEANLIALRHKPTSVELMDKAILDLTKENISQKKNRFFLQGDPGALLIVEYAEQSTDIIATKVNEMKQEMEEAGFGFHFPVVRGADIKKVWELRKAGLGVLSNYPGDAKPVPVIEDTAVAPELLPQYIKELQNLLDILHLPVVYYAHIATGELHIRPVLNLKDPKGVELFHTVALETAKLVKRYKGSLSGEHGDGRLRGEFIPLMIGEKNYALLEDIKNTWDPKGIFNPGKITHTPPMNSMLRLEPGKETRKIETIFDFSNDNGILRAVERCNGTADCRKSEIIGGTMCPSYMATRDETTTTRARANVLREFLTNSTKKNPFDHKEIYDVLDLCISCKGCKSECPSNVDITKYKAEFLQHYYDANGIKLRTRLIANISKVNRLGSIVPGLFNFFVKTPVFAQVIKNTIGFAPKRNIPLLQKHTLTSWYKKYKRAQVNSDFPKGKVFLFVDEFTNYNDTEIGIAAIKLLTHLGYQVEIPGHTESGRTYLSKGLLYNAKDIANTNVEFLKDVVNEKTPLIGIEPSGILTFRDEYRDLVKPDLKKEAEKLATNCLMFDEFIIREFEAGKINADLFSNEPQSIKLHGHCHQKSLASIEPTKKMLEIPANSKVEEIKSGCCGMAGSFGYEKEHYEVSMKIGELVLFPEIRKTPEEFLIAAPGTSCRHQIKDGTGRKAYHPIEILFDQLKNKN